MYEGINDLNLSCPAVSHNCNLTVLSSKYIVFERKSIPIVAFTIKIYSLISTNSEIIQYELPDNFYQNYRT